MNYLDGYVEEVLSEPYYDDYGSGIFRWWVEVSYVCEGTESTTILFRLLSTRIQNHLHFLLQLIILGRREQLH